MDIKINQPILLNVIDERLYDGQSIELNPVAIQKAPNIGTQVHFNLGDVPFVFEILHQMWDCGNDVSMLFHVRSLYINSEGAYLACQPLKGDLSLVTIKVEILPA